MGRTLSHSASIKSSKSWDIVQRRFWASWKAMSRMAGSVVRLMGMRRGRLGLGVRGMEGV
jgi:hypothetical protein